MSHPDSKFGGTSYYEVKLDNQTFEKQYTVHCNNNEEFLEQLNGFTFGLHTSYKILDKKEPKPAFRKRYKLSVDVVATIYGTKFVHFASYEEAKAFLSKPSN